MTGTIELESQIQDALKRFTEVATVDLRSVGARHPVFGVLDGAQWLRFSAVHTWRHRSQLLALRREITG